MLLQTLQGLAFGVQVRHIATTPLSCCSVSDSVEAVLAADEWKLYSQIPVREGDCTCGVLERSALRDVDGLVRQAMKPLDDSMLVAAGAPLTDFLQIAAGSTYRLVVDGGKVNGIITRSDLQKLPVRIVIFTFVTNLELLMADVIRSFAPAPAEWRQYLSEDRRERVKSKFDQLSRSDFYVDELTCTDFCDKRTILKGFLNDLSKDFTKDLKQIEKLRNSVFHAGEYAQNQQELAVLVDQYERARRWTNDLQRRLREHTGGVKTPIAAGTTFEATDDDVAQAERPA
ncbi:MAG: CBS domain-containing protein [Bryobacterales bacterium]|nr:CBS domain-containing protein [Bryobacterales bacterium]